MPLGAWRLNGLARSAAAATPSRTAKTITAYNSAQVDTAQSKFGGASLLVARATTDYISVDNSSNDLDFGTNEFTIEFFYRPATIPIGSVFHFLYDSRETGAGTQPSIGVTNAGEVFYFTAGAFRIQAAAAISANNWYHIAVVRSSGTTTLYVDGTSKGTYSDSNTYTARTDVRIGANFNTANGADGHIDEIRISDNARYTGNFTAPTAAFSNDANTLLLVHCDGADGSTTFTDDVF